MRVFLVKVVLFSVIILSVIMALSWSVPYYWGEPTLLNKMVYLKQHKKQFNALFIGSSHVYRQINPKLFDQLTMGETSSFNLGISGMFTVETFEIYGRMIRDEANDNIRYAFIELYDIPKIADVNLHAIRSKYFMSYDSYKFAVASLGHHPFIDEAEREHQIKNYRIAYCENLLKLGLIRPILEFHLDRKKISKNILGKSSDGFFPLEEEMGRESKRWQSIRLDASLLEERITGARKCYQETTLAEANGSVLQKLQELIEASRRRNIELIFLVFPLSPQYESLLPLARGIKGHTIDLGNPFENPEFYSLDYCYDQGHLNSKGARLLTERMAEKFNLLMQNRLARNSAHTAALPDQCGGLPGYYPDNR